MIFQNQTLEGGLIDKFQLNSFQDFLRDFKMEINQPGPSYINSTRMGQIMAIPQSPDISIRLTFWHSKYMDLIVNHEIDKYNRFLSMKKADYVTDLIVYDDNQTIYFHNVMLRSTQEDPKTDNLIMEFSAEYYDVTYNINSFTPKISIKTPKYYANDVDIYE